MKKLIIGLMVLCLGVTLASAVYAAGWEPEKFTDNSVDDANPSLYNGTISWIKEVGSYYDVYYYDGTSSSAITDNTAYVSNPSLYDGKIAYERYNMSTFKTDICYWDGNTITNLTNTPNDSEFFPSLYNGEIAWSGWDGSDYEIYHWDGNNITPITNNAVKDVLPSLYDGKIAWQSGENGSEDILYWDGVGTTNITNDADNNTNPSLYDGKIAYDHYDGDGDWNIYYWDGAATTQITDYVFTDTDPWLYNGMIAWRSYNATADNFDILLWNGEGIRKITDDMKDDRFPAIHLSAAGGPMMAWHGDDGDWEIYTGMPEPASMLFAFFGIAGAAITRRFR